MTALIIIITFIIIAVVLFLKLSPVFGGRASAQDREYYEKHASNYSDGRFTYPDEWEINGLSENIHISMKSSVPEGELPQAVPDFSEKPDIDELNVTWSGHSTLLIQMQGMNILIDPVFSDRPSPVSFAGTTRYSSLPLNIEDLPRIDMVIISHDHYDHLDMNSIIELDEITDRFIVPLGVENHLERWLSSDEKITRLAWWEETDINGLTLICTPARHGSGRSLDDQRSTLWASWILKNESYQIYESGDTGYGGHFEEIHKRYGDFDLVMIDCAQYNMNWHYNHMFPEESAMAAMTLGAELVMPIHWGAFVLSNHAWDDPPERFTLAAEKLSLTVLTPLPGETMWIDEPEKYMNRWWQPLP